MGEEMMITHSILLEELERNRRLRLRYLRELGALPIGTMMLREIHGNEYCYMNYFINGKIVSKNIGKKTSGTLGMIEENIEKRRKIEYVMNKLLAEEEEIRAAIR